MHCRFYEISPQKIACSYVATLFRFVARFAHVGILKTRPGGSCELLVSVSESGFPFYFFCVQFSYEDVYEKGYFCLFISFLVRILFLVTKKTDIGCPRGDRRIFLNIY